MKLSEAIRIGSKLHPQFFGQLRGWVGDRMGTCVLAAAVDGLSKAHNGDMLLHQAWPIMLLRVSCPACERPIDTIQHRMIHLNDDHRWSRETIADWVEQFEKEDVNPSTPQTITVKEEIYEGQEAS